MKATNSKIIVRCDIEQKNSITVGGVTVSTALLYETNFREKSPVVAEVIEGNNYVESGDILLCHHNTFYMPSPYYLSDDLFSIPFNQILFAKVSKNGDLMPICGNLICNRVEIDSYLPLPTDQIKTYTDRAVVLNGGFSEYKKNELIFHRPHAGYDIVYVWNGQEKRITKVHESQIVGVAVEAKN